MWKKYYLKSKVLKSKTRLHNLLKSKENKNNKYTTAEPTYMYTRVSCFPTFFDDAFRDMNKTIPKNIGLSLEQNML